MNRVFTCFLWFLSALSMAAGLANAGTNGDNHGPARYTVREIIAPEDARCQPGYETITYARRLNERAQIAGYYYCFEQTGDPAAPILQDAGRAFRWTRIQGSVALPDLTTTSHGSSARDINEAGTAVGWDEEYNGLLAPLWPFAGGVSEAIAATTCPDFVITRGEGINDRGAIVGTNLVVSDDGNCQVHWILKLANGTEYIAPFTGGSPSALNNQNVAVGTNGNAIRWSPTSGVAVTILSAADNAQYKRATAWNINDRNEAVGYVDIWREDFGCVQHSDARFWTRTGIERALPSLPGFITGIAYGINKDSDVVGYAQATSSCDPLDTTAWRAVLWHSLRPVDLNGLIPRATAREIQLTFASAINDAGQIVARGFRKSEPLAPCPQYTFDPVTEQLIYDTTLLCRNDHAYLLTPADDL